MSANVGMLDKGLSGIRNIIEHNTGRPINKLHYFVGCYMLFFIMNID
ncbi:MAG TPA: hypothetical protein ACFYEJ_09680 [Candidatus Wujingus californicus]|nr:hypothetical protein [Planctomycetota bacterium]